MRNKFMLVGVLCALITPLFSHADTATIHMRVGSTVVGPYTITLADMMSTSTATTTSILPVAGPTVAIPTNTPLAILYSIQASTTDFSIAQIQYFNGLGLYLKCVTVPAFASKTLCNNWQYMINGITPTVGADTATLSNGDDVYFYFGPQDSVSISTSTAVVGDPVQTTVNKYDPATNTFVPYANVVVGVVQFDANFNPVEFATSTTDATGTATLIVNTSGTYEIGVQSDGYSPSQTLVVASSTATTTPTGGGGSGGNPIGTSTTATSTVTHAPLNVSAALAYLASQQQSDGSFGADLYTDWAAMALGATQDSHVGLTRSYLQSHIATLSSVTDYERHALALEAVGINPYSGTSIDTITPIIRAFDGTQIGDVSNTLDDVFGILALEHVGYTSQDPIIRQSVAFILSQQRTDGSWGGDIDTTAATMQAVGPLFALPGVNASMGRAIQYVVGQQQAQGGWNNVDSTSWVQMAINLFLSFHVGSLATWTTSTGYYPSDALGRAQASDGAVRPSTDIVTNRVWSTSYAIVAGANKDWLRSFNNFTKPVIILSSGGAGGNVINGATSTNTTSATATSSPATTTSIIIDSTATSTATTTPIGQVLGVSTSTTGTTTIRYIPKRIPKAIKKVIPAPVVEAITAVVEGTTTSSSTSQTPRPTWWQRLSHWVVSFW